jgi:hypothetical protein
MVMNTWRLTSLSSTRWLLICFLFGGRLLHSAETDSFSPRWLAFNSGILPHSENSGILPPDSTKEAVTKLHGEMDSKDPHIIHHRWIEAFEIDFRTSTRSITVFDACQSTFGPGLADGEVDLKELVIHYVVLDYMGKPKKAMKVVFRLDVTGWRRSEESEDLSQFRKSLTQSDLDELQLTSGLLSRFPGQSVVSYDSDAALFVKFGSVVFSAAATMILPSVAAAVGAAESAAFAVFFGMALDAGKELVARTAEEWLERGKTHWGRDSFVSDRRLRNSDINKYAQDAGRDIWSNVGAIPPANLPTGLTTIVH